MNKAVLSLLVPATLAAVPAQAVEADFSLNTTLTTDSRWRGVSLTNTQPALQLTADLFFDNGFYLGSWLSHIENGTLDANNQLSGEQDIELHAWGGYSNFLTDEIGYAGSIMFYNYPEPDANLTGFSEYIATVFGYGFVVEYAYSNDFSGLGTSSHYFDVDFEQPLMENLTLNLHAGHSWGEYADLAMAGSYTDLSASLKTSHFGFDFSLDLIHNILDDSQKFNPNDIFSNFVFTDNGSTAVFSIGKTF
ncbi:TorF family putative porin [Paraferrimonas sp. SM1919]|uniref:TorF family putative porin n=1 Tax=Paraferrimonas sp. SM1919 TaxID=2662263 RepID=UPI0013D24BEB|nr:TorF family putative porin [Paraferrimonas sp. SM1919]